MTIPTGPLPAAEKKRDMPFLCAQDSGDLDLHPPCGHARPHPRCRVYADDSLHQSRIRRHRSPLPGIRGLHTAPVPDTTTSIPAAGYTRTTHCTGPGYDDIDPRCRVYADDPEPNRPAGDTRTGSRDRELRGVSHQPGPGDCQRTLGDGGQACGEPLFPKGRPVSPAPHLEILAKRPHGPGYPPCLSGPWSHHCGEPMSRQGGAYRKIHPPPPPSGSGPATGRYGCVTPGGEREMRAST